MTNDCKLRFSLSHVLGARVNASQSGCSQSPLTLTPSPSEGEREVRLPRVASRQGSGGFPSVACPPTPLRPGWAHSGPRPFRPQRVASRPAGLGSKRLYLGWAELLRPGWPRSGPRPFRPQHVARSLGLEENLLHLGRSEPLSPGWAQSGPRPFRLRGAHRCTGNSPNPSAPLRTPHSAL